MAYRRLGSFRQLDEKEEDEELTPSQKARKEVEKKTGYKRVGSFADDEGGGRLAKPRGEEIMEARKKAREKEEVEEKVEEEKKPSLIEKAKSLWDRVTKKKEVPEEARPTHEEAERKKREVEMIMPDMREAGTSARLTMEGQDVFETPYRQFAAGTGDVLTVAGYASTWLGFDGVGQDLAGRGGSLQQLAVEDNLGEFNWKMLYDPRFYATRITRTLPFAVALVPTAIVGAYAGATAAGAVGLGAFGTYVLGAIGAASLSRPIESALEAGSTYDEALRRGDDIKQATDVANKTFWGNMSLASMDAAEFALAFAPVKGGNKFLRIVMKGAALTGNIVGEGAEEVIQRNISKVALGEPIDITSKEAQEEFAIGGLMGMGLSVSGSVFNTIKGNVLDAYPVEADELRKEYDEIEVLDKLSEKHPKEVKEIIDSTIEQVTQSPTREGEPVSPVELPEPISEEIEKEKGVAPVEKETSQEATRAVEEAIKKAPSYTSGADFAKAEFSANATDQIGTVGSKEVTARDPIDRKAVDDYKKRIQAGEAIEPIEISKTKEGTFETTDGSHRITAYQELNLDAPVVYRGTDAVEGLVPFEQVYSVMQKEKAEIAPKEPVKPKPTEVKAGVGETITGEKVEYLKMSKVKGEKYFAEKGYVQQPNKNFWRKGDTYAHFNTHDKTWHIVEEADTPTKPKLTDIPAKEKELVAEYSKSKDKVEEALDQVFMEMDEAEAGERIFKDGEFLKAKPSSFPKWIPEEYRSAKLFGKVLGGLQSVESIKYPPPNAPKQQALYDYVLDMVDQRAEIDTSAIRGDIIKAYEAETKPQKVKKPSPRRVKRGEPVRPKKVPEKEVVPKKEKITGTEKELASGVEERIGEIIPPIGLGIRKVTKAPISDKVRGLEFTDKGVESRYKAARGITTSKYYTGKVKAFIKNFSHRFTRTYPDLPNTTEFAELRVILNKQKAIREVTKDRAVRIVQGITADIGPNKLDLLTRKVILDDLTQEAKADRPLPFGYSEYDKNGNLVIKRELLGADKEKVDRLLFENPDVAEALSRRDKIWKAITDELVKYDILKKDQIKKGYYRHMVLEHAHAKTRAVRGVGTKLKKRKPGYAKERRGSTYDINTDYLETEFEVMSQALHDVGVAELLKQVEGLSINIKSKLLKEARAKGVDWHDLIPEGYTTWQPKDGRAFYSVYTVPQRLVNEFVDQVGSKTLKIDQDLINKALAVGGMRKELVLPESASKTLDTLWVAKQPNFIRDVAKKAVTLWKKWVLFNPRRAFKYNYQNFLGDSDAVFAANPAVFKKLPRAAKELYAVYAKDAPMPERMKEFFTRGGFSSTFSVQEIPDVRSVRAFGRFYRKMETKTILQKINLVNKYWKSVRGFTQFRESLLRYASYLDFVERFESGKKLKYGASKKAEVDAISNPKDKAAKVATELLGDYANLTAFGKDMRESLIPFYSWIEINFKRYPAIVKASWRENYKDGKTATARAAGVTAVKGAWAVHKTMVRMSAMTALVALYNQLFFPDEEEDLNEYDKGRMHINLGYDEDGNVRILRGQGAFSDLLEWFGLSEAPVLWREYFDGKASLVDIFGKIPLVTGRLGLKPAVEKIVGSISPTYKTPVEFISGFSWPYQGSKSYPISDKWRQVFRNIQMENEYDFIFQKPSRGYLKSWGYAVVTKTDPLENAYRYIQAEKYRYWATKGKGGTGNYYTPRSIVYRNYKKALMYGDKKAEDRAYGELKKLGVKQKDLAQSLKWAEPLSGLSKQEKYEFVKDYLSVADRERLKKALQYYEKVFK